MSRTVAIGAQNFGEIIKRNNFYVDKTLFIKEWWESYDEVTLITRPRRFGKTLNMNMLERFFSVEFKGKGEVFEGLDIWKDKKYKELQGTYPVISLSFAGVKEDNYDGAVYTMCKILQKLYIDTYFLLDSDVLTDGEKRKFKEMADDGVNIADASTSIQMLSDYLCRYYGKKTIILLDEYDTPLQEAYVGGYWDKIVSFTRTFFNNTFKTNPYLERAIMTGITRVSKESLFSDLNNLKVLTITSNKYASYFGFTEEEVFAAMDEFGMTNKDEVKRWYDGFTVGKLKDIYNPWSIINFLDEGELKTYWANTSSNGLVSSLIKKAGKDIKMQFEELLHKRSIICEIDDEMVFNQLGQDENAIWSLLYASGYLTTLNVDDYYNNYELVLTNYEVEIMFKKMVKAWFRQDRANYNGFIQALLKADVETMNEYMNQVSETMFSSFDGGKKPSARTAPERFYHGFVLGLLVDLAGRYEITSNRESGFGRYDVMLKPLKEDDYAIIMEFKIFNPKKESSMEETVQSALRQIDEKKYEQTLLEQGIEEERICRYGFAFEGKKVLIG